MYLFSMDNPFFRLMGRLTDLVWVNILTLICCVPVFTAGAAISAMYHVLVKMALKEEGAITRAYFKAFKDNFKNATIVWLPSVLVFLILSSNAYLIHQGVLNVYPKLLLAAGISLGVVAAGLFIFLNYYFSLISRYENDIKQSAKNALLLMLAYFPRSICILVIWLFPLALMMLSDYFFFLWFIYGLSFPGYFNAMVLGALFIKTEKGE